MEKEKEMAMEAASKKLSEEHKGELREEFSLPIRKATVPSPASK